MNYIEIMMKNNQLKLLAIGNSNWDFYINENNLVYAWPKQGEKYKGCKPSYYGDLTYFNSIYANILKSEEIAS